MSDREKLIKADQEKSIDIISHIDDFWLLHQIYRFMPPCKKNACCKAPESLYRSSQTELR